MTKQLSIPELLQKHIDSCPHGGVAQLARDLKTHRQRIYEWSYGKTVPRPATQQTIIEYFKSQQPQ